MIAETKRDALLETLKDDSHRTYRAIDVDPAAVHPTAEELPAWAKAHPKASLEGWEAILRGLSRGEEPGPLLVEQAGDDYVLAGASALGKDQPASLALLYALRRAGKTSWPAVLSVDGLSKQDEGDDQEDPEAIDEPDTEGFYTLAQNEKDKAHTTLYAWAALIAASVLAALQAGVPDLAEAGADWGGGADASDIDSAIRATLAEQAGYLNGFKDDMQTRIDAFLENTWADEASFDTALSSLITWAQDRAESYSRGGGQQAWRDAAYIAMNRNGTAGGFWICTFGKGSCTDCRTLHGQYLTRQELRDTWGNTECNGGCLCGFEPAEGPGGIDEEVLAAMDAGAGEGLE